MKYVSLSAVIFFALLIAPSATATNYDQQLAKSFGADDYGMKQYVMAFLYKGPNRDLPEEEAIALQRGHLNTIRTLAKDGKLVLAGPFLEEGELRGIYIFDVTHVDEAKKLVADDPAIQHGSLVVEMKPWYGSAALMDLYRIHKSIAKKEH
ncbi:YciI family protein [Paraferrimonas haliotis]|uniref:YCII-related domain-containing protein n=1 Tax=Paraferrimonas haliotis TaxID=2013866 RepID=A0AA37WXL6_9GAMM|nr:YciI family protein [Paraferrimonas haliotis]GLS82655.1 hypothetical protein GCM10007894_06320 [Paraferrimonas haliotis]